MVNQMVSTAVKAAERAASNAYTTCKEVFYTWQARTYQVHVFRTWQIVKWAYCSVKLQTKNVWICFIHALIKWRSMIHFLVFSLQFQCIRLDTAKDNCLPRFKSNISKLDLIFFFRRMLLPRIRMSSNRRGQPGNLKVTNGNQRRRSGSPSPWTLDQWRNSSRWASVTARRTRSSSPNTTQTWIEF